MFIKFYSYKMGVCQAKAQEIGAFPIEQVAHKTHRKHIFSQHPKQQVKKPPKPQESSLTYDQLPELLQQTKRKQQRIKQLQAFIKHINKTSVFKVYRSSTSTKIIHLANGYWHSFIKERQIPTNTITNFKIRVFSQDIMVGIVTDAIFGKANPHLHKQSLVYRTHDSGYLYQDGKSKKCKKGVQKGQTIQVNVDLNLWKINWKVGLQKIAETVIPASMMTKNVYFGVMMYWQKDQVDLVCE